MNLWDKYQLFIYVAAAALLTWWLQQLYEQRAIEIKVAEHSPDFFSSGYYKKAMGLDGLPKSELTAAIMRHYKADGSTHLEQPVMVLHHPNAAPWVIQSDSGIMAADGDHLQLNGKAVISREASQGSSALTINTSDLRVELSTHFAETTAWADIISPPNQTSGTGMEVTFVSPIHLKLLSKVKGRYEIK
ncbi:MAG: LPS export ABC transporter periplasmic protein LptC [Methylomonas sp.]|jgi:lipopolysaccharide export system protein LptC|uniref:LPS export ABC transporter periplasmic protein LptC n=1 Tax=Methylomonas sp. TaxID=418 RepID=UPI0025D7938D|nr:LPS export ABC transporter periplasmic protein LptC [Methylomonas sp.]MCK9607368.1 LPS export ABC transporter periplasmic protein LptC [Methylomonas sp.]